MDAAEDCLRRVRIFISSPGDVPLERKRVRRAVDRVNRLVAKDSGILLEPMGWEDVPPGGGDRAQAVINPHVQTASIFIGILNKRFGSATGKAESGTREEFDIVARRCQEESPPPEVMVYFKRLRPSDTDDPGPQLKKLIAFKEGISAKFLYGEYASLDDLEEKVETALAQWVHGAKNTLDTQVGVASNPISDEAIALLSRLVEAGTFSLTELQSLASDLDSEQIVADLRSGGLLRIGQGKARIPSSTKVFLRITRYLLDRGHAKTLLQSGYFVSTIKRILGPVVTARYHCDLDPEHRGLLMKLACLSPRVAEYLLLGDTELYDNLREQAERIGQSNQAQEWAQRGILHRALLAYAQDDVEGHLQDSAGKMTVEGQVVSVRVSAAHAEGLAFAVESRLPSLRVKAGEDMERGSMVTGPVEITIKAGCLFSFMEEDVLALREFDKALAVDLRDDQRALVLNNRGVVLRRQGRMAEARVAFHEATQLDPSLKEAKNNLRLLETSEEV